MTPHLRRGLLDTNTVILLPRLNADHLPLVPVVSTLSLAELCVGPLVARDQTKRRVREAQLAMAWQAFDALPFDRGAAEAFGVVSSSLRRAGRIGSARSIDALIAAVAMAHRLPLYTCDPGDFAGIDGLDVVAVPHPDRN